MSPITRYLIAIFCACFGLAAHAFPDRTVVLVVPFTSSSGSDIIARILAPKLSERWKQPVIVDNKPGASGNLGAQFVAQAAPDGHTLLMAINTITMTPAIYKNMPFDTSTDFAPVLKLAEANYALAVHPSIQAKDLASLVALSKKNPGTLNYASPGSGTPHHLAMELYKLDTGLDATHVPYKGIQGALTDLIGGQVQLMFATAHSLKPHVQAGRLRLLATTGNVRNSYAPEVPSFREQGVNSMDNVDSWYAVMAPAKTSADLVQRLNRDFIEVLNQDDIKAALMQQGMVVRTSTPEQLGSIIKSDLQRWKKVVTDARITAN
jgi:tripartite-type tricarboxylate transporter receptor subunit TctC